MSTSHDHQQAQARLLCEEIAKIADRSDLLCLYAGCEGNIHALDALVIQLQANLKMVG